MKKYVFITCSLLTLASSCVQRYDAPPLNTPTATSWKETQNIPLTPASCPEPEQVLQEASFRPWWKVFNDHKLNELEYQAIKESPKVKAAIARLESAMAVYGITRASLFPEVDLDVTANRKRISQTLGSSSSSKSSSNQAQSQSTPPMVPPISQCVVCPPPPMCSCPAPPKPSSHLTTLGVLPVLTYDLDFWGKNWQATQSSMQLVQAEQEDVQNTLLQLTTSVADAYLQLRTFDVELDVLKQTLVTRQDNFNLNKSQFEAGLINALPMELAESDLESVATSIESTSKNRASVEHRLAELIGLPASTFTLEKQTHKATLPSIAAGVPSTMLQRRPDIRQALALIEAAALNVGVAKTAYFPDFTLTLDYGYLSSKANKLFKWKSHTWYAAVDAFTPLFTAGRISSTIEDAIAQYKQAVANYLETVLVAFKQVEDALFNIEATKRQLKHLRLDVLASRRAYEIAMKRYRMGLEGYLNVINTERTLLVVERVEIQVTREQFSNIISLINSLGGYWENSTNEKIISSLSN